ncbi:MAG: DUF2946 family protein [Rhodoferax sp.]|nr:DUF2946 family protein [Rhodoferax sp.]
MHTLRNAPWLARLALLWFALTLGAAVASPMVQPQQELVICTGAGMLKVVLADDGTVTTAATSDTGDALFCPLCLAGGAPPAVVVEPINPPQSTGRARQGTPTVHIAARSAAPLPARGPPHA